jgi:16S rRNA (guanine966-N2)-methyltransferase
MSPPPVVRLTGGEFSGRRVRGAHGLTRPATARLRRSIFDRPDVWACLDGPVLDLYAGAGLLGLEALSRGAPHVEFVERDRPACAIIGHNLGSLGCTSRGTVHCRPVERALPTLPAAQFRLCIADPPYPVDATPVLEDLLTRRLLAADALLLWRHPANRPAHDALGALARVDQRRYGDAVLDTYTIVPLASPDGDAPGLRPDGEEGAER